MTLLKPLTPTGTKKPLAVFSLAKTFLRLTIAQIKTTRPQSSLPSATFSSTPRNDKWPTSFKWLLRIISFAIKLTRRAFYSFICWPCIVKRSTLTPTLIKQPPPSHMPTALKKIDRRRICTGAIKRSSQWKPSFNNSTLIRIRSKIKSRADMPTGTRTTLLPTPRGFTPIARPSDSRTTARSAYTKYDKLALPSRLRPNPQGIARPSAYLKSRSDSPPEPRT